jgi:hypothetical protein
MQQHFQQPWIAVQHRPTEFKLTGKTGPTHAKACGSYNERCRFESVGSVEKCGKRSAAVLLASFPRPEAKISRFPNEFTLLTQP